MTSTAQLDSRQRALLDGARTATLATLRRDGTPRLVPVCFVASEVPADGALLVHTPIDDKPKATDDPRSLARVRDILRRPDVGLLVHRWDEDWAELAWLRLGGVARLVEPTEREPHAPAIARLREKYPQYADHDLEHRPLIEIRVEEATCWFAG